MTMKMKHTMILVQLKSHLYIRLMSSGYFDSLDSRNDTEHFKFYFTPFSLSLHDFLINFYLLIKYYFLVLLFTQKNLK